MPVQHIEEIRKNLSSIEKYYLSAYKDDLPQNSYGLLTGLAGITLLQVFLYNKTKNKTLKTGISKNIKHLTSSIEQGKIHSPTFCDGLAGIGWLFIYLNEKKIIDIEIGEYLRDLDSFLEKELERMLKVSNFDPLHGAVGLGLYFLKRKNLAALEKVIRSLDSSAIKIQTRISWKQNERYPSEINVFDIGLAHGNAGILYFLGKCYKKKILPETCLKLINGNVAFYLFNVQDHAENGSFFPLKIEIGNKNIQLDKRSYSRLAWCYGDLSIFHTLVLISIWTKNTALTQKITSHLKKTILRVKRNETGVNDACFCHGTSGIGYLYLSLYKLLHLDSIQKAAQYWIHQTILYNHSSEDSLRYQFYNGDLGWRQLPGLLDGIGGLSLVLLTYSEGKRNNDWSEIFFLS